MDKNEIFKEFCINGTHSSWPIGSDDFASRLIELTEADNLYEAAISFLTTHNKTILADIIPTDSMVYRSDYTQLYITAKRIIRRHHETNL